MAALIDGLSPRGVGRPSCCCCCSSSSSSIRPPPPLLLPCSEPPVVARVTWTGCLVAEGVAARVQEGSPLGGKAMSARQTREKVYRGRRRQPPKILFPHRPQNYIASCPPRGTSYFPQGARVRLPRWSPMLDRNREWDSWRLAGVGGTVCRGPLSLSDSQPESTEDDDSRPGTGPCCCVDVAPSRASTGPSPCSSSPTWAATLGSTGEAEGSRGGGGGWVCSNSDAPSSRSAAALSLDSSTIMVSSRTCPASPCQRPVVSTAKQWVPDLILPLSPAGGR